MDHPSKYTTVNVKTNFKCESQADVDITNLELHMHPKYQTYGLKSILPFLNQ